MQPPIGEDFFRAHDRRRARAAGRHASWKRPAGSASRSSGATAIATIRRASLGRGAALSPPPRCGPRRPSGRFFYASGRSSNEAAFLLQCFARVFGTNNVNNCSYYCHQASSVALQTAIGTRHGHGDARRSRASRPGRGHRRQPGVEPSPPDHAARRPAAPRRQGDRDQSAERDRAGALPRAVGLAQHAASARTSRDLYLQPHVGARHRAAQAAAQGRRSTRGGVDRGLSCAAHVDGWDAVRGRRRAASRATRCCAACGVPAAEVDRRRDLPLRARADDLRLGDGHHAARARRRQRAGPRQSRAGAGHGSAGRAPACCRSAATQRARRGLGRREPGAEDRVCAPAGGALRRHAARSSRACTRWPRSRRRPRDASTPRCCSAATCSSATPDRALGRAGAAQDRHHGVRHDEAQRGTRPRPRPDRSHAAGAGARRRAPVHDAGEHVQLRARLRRRRGRGVRRDAPGGRDHRQRSPALVLPAGPVDFGSLARSRRHPRGDRARRAGLRGDRRASIARAASSTIAGRIFHEPRFGTDDGRARFHRLRRRPARRGPASSV